MTAQFKHRGRPPVNPDCGYGDGLVHTGHGGIDEWEDIEDFPPEGQQMPVRK